MSQNNLKSFVIIGGGACGLVAAIEAAKRGLKVTVYEKNTKVGRKILATGNGRCNITNQSIKAANYHSQSPSFVNTCLSRFGSSKCIEYFGELGLEMTQGEKGRMYPMNQQSSTVVDILLIECKRLGVEFVLSSEVTKIAKSNDKFIIETADKKATFDFCLCATGSLAMPTLGGSDSGYNFATLFGHKLIPVAASLVQLVCHEKELKDLSGVKVVGNIDIYTDGQKRKSAFGDILFTNYGISGSAVLDVSRVASVSLQTNQKVFVVLDLLPNFTKEGLEKLLQKRLKIAYEKSLSLWLEGLINKKLAPFIITRSELPKHISKASQLGIKEIKKLVHTLKNIKLSVIDTKGFASAEVCAGGVDVSDINPNTFESKIVKNLYFGGEVLDVDGDCGGYNLHFAWASGFVAANAVG